jgi:hypothetical protein
MVKRRQVLAELLKDTAVGVPRAIYYGIKSIPRVLWSYVTYSEAIGKWVYEEDKRPENLGKETGPVGAVVCALIPSAIEGVISALIVDGITNSNYSAFLVPVVMSARIIHAAYSTKKLEMLEAERVNDSASLSNPI